MVKNCQNQIGLSRIEYCFCDFHRNSEFSMYVKWFHWFLLFSAVFSKAWKGCILWGWGLRPSPLTPPPEVHERQAPQTPPTENIGLTNLLNLSNLRNLRNLHNLRNLSNFIAWFGYAYVTYSCPESWIRSYDTYTHTWTCKYIHIPYMGPGPCKVYVCMYVCMYVHVYVYEYVS